MTTIRGSKIAGQNLKKEEDARGAEVFSVRPQLAREQERKVMDLNAWLYVVSSGFIFGAVGYLIGLAAANSSFHRNRAAANALRAMEDHFRNNFPDLKLSGTSVANILGARAARFERYE